jgi:hypothetical protein
MYLTIDDLKTFLDENEILALQREYEADGIEKIPQGIEFAEQYVRDRLNSIYNMDAELSKTGNSRSKTLLEIIAHIAIWKLAIVYPTVQVDSKRNYNYEDAMKNIDLIAKGQLLTNLPAIADSGTDQKPGGIRYGFSTETEIIY